MNRTKPLARSTKPIPRKRTKPRRGSLKDPAYLAWIRTLPCCVCRLGPPIIEKYGLIPKSEAAHIGVRGLGQKCSDHEMVPLCRYHHRTGPQAIHRIGKYFWVLMCKDPAELIAKYNALYRESR